MAYRANLIDVGVTLSFRSRQHCAITRVEEEMIQKSSVWVTSFADEQGPSITAPSIRAELGL